MRVAVLVSGRVNSAQGRTGLIRNNTRLKEKFPGADFYYGAWNIYKSEFESVFPHETCEYFEEPVMHYHPYEISNKYHINKQYRDTAKWALKAERKEWTSHHTKQILIHSWLLDKISKKYDIIIRTRFDAFIHRSADFSRYITDTFENNRANGFATTRKQLFAILCEQKKPKSNKDEWHWFCDQLIIHPPSFITKQVVDRLNQKKRLHPAEFGWAQVLSYPYGLNHRAHKGWVNHDRNILDVFLKEEDK